MTFPNEIPNKFNIKEMYILNIFGMGLQVIMLGDWHIYNY